MLAYSILLVLLLAVPPRVIVSYVPNEAVTDAHHIPHLVVVNNGLARGPDNFRVSGGDLQGCLMALLPFPAIITALGIFSLLVFQLLLCLRCFRCCKCLKMKPTEEFAVTHPLQVVTSSRRILSFFAFCILFTTMALHALWLAYKDLTTGIAMMGSAVESLKNIFKTMQSSGTSMGIDFATVATAVTTNPECFKSTTEAAAFAAAGSVAGGGINALSSPVIPLLSAFQANVVSSGQLYTLYVIAGLYAVGMSLVVGLGLGVILTSKWGVWIIIALTELVILVSTLVSCVEMLFVMLVGGFCMEPVDFVVSLTSSSDLQNILNLLWQMRRRCGQPFR